jgi:Cys/Met metabolism PLP-dependent enzyme
VAGAICGTTAFVSSMMDPHSGPLFLLGPVLDAKASSELILRVPHLALRVTEASRRALAYAEALKAEGAKVCYPGLADHPHAATFARLANPGYGAGAVFTVDAGSGGAASRLMERLQNAAGFGLMAVSLGYHETLLSVSGASTSSELSPEDRAAAGITDGLLRVSVGITGTMEQRRASLIAAWRAHVAAEAARAAGAAPGWRAARVQPDPAAPNGISRVASWDSFGDPDEDDAAGAAGGDALWDGTAATPGDRAAVDLAARMGAKLKVKLGGAKVLYVRSDARAEGV